MNAPIRLTCFLAVTLLAAPALAKPLYITVPRSYGSEEAPAVDVAFEGTDPVELRVLRPEPLEPYLAAQSNLRRAYQLPPTLLNPGRHLARGLNAVHGPGTFLLGALSPEWRQAIGGFPPREQAQASRPLSRLDEGPSKLVGLPPGMALVHREWLNLDLGGDVRNFDVPGFSGWFRSESGYQERRVNLLVT